MTKPTETPRWATDDEVDPTSGQNNVEEPTEEEKDSGWTYLQKPPRQYFNWLARLTNAWLSWLNDRIFDGENEEDTTYSSPTASGGRTIISGADAEAGSNNLGGSVTVMPGRSTGTGSAQTYLMATEPGTSGSTYNSQSTYVALNGSSKTISLFKPMFSQVTGDGSTSQENLKSLDAYASVGSTARPTASPEIRMSVRNANALQASASATPNTQRLGHWSFNGYTSTTYFESASISAFASGGWSHNTQYPTSIRFATTAGTTKADRWEINESGHLRPLGGTAGDTGGVGSSDVGGPNHRVNTIYAEDIECSKLVGSSIDYPAGTQIRLACNTRKLVQFGDLSIGTLDVIGNANYPTKIVNIDTTKPGQTQRAGVVLPSGYFQAFYSIPRGVKLKTFNVQYKKASNSASSRAKFGVRALIYDSTVNLTQDYWLDLGQATVDQATGSNGSAGIIFSYPMNSYNTALASSLMIEVWNSSIDGVMSLGPVFLFDCEIEKGTNRGGGL